MTKILLKDYIYFLLYVAIKDSKVLNIKEIILYLEFLVNYNDKDFILELDNFISFCYDFSEALKIEGITCIADFYYLMECLKTVREILNYSDNEYLNIYLVDIDTLYEKYEQFDLIRFRQLALEFFLDF
jgi:hypothetical protein